MSQRFYKSKFGHVYEIFRPYHDELCKKADEENITLFLQSGS